MMSSTDDMNSIDDMPDMDDMSDMDMGDDSSGEAYCSGSGVSMYMSGFVWGEESNDGKFACLNILFRNWTLDTKTKFIWSIVATVGLGILVEAIVMLRRDAAVAEQAAMAAAAEAKTYTTKIAWDSLRLLLMVLHSSLAYMLMLVAMSFRAELFLAIVAGLGLGHALFNLNAPVAYNEDSSACHPTSTPPAPPAKSKAVSALNHSPAAAEAGEALHASVQEDAKELTVAELECGVAAAVESLSAATAKMAERARKQLDLARQRHDAEGEKKAHAVLGAAQKAAADHAEFYALAYATAAAESGTSKLRAVVETPNPRPAAKPPPSVPEAPASNWTLTGIGKTFGAAL
jgi:hypothetical protein